MAPPSPPVPFLYEDNHLLVVDKPAGLLSQADESGRPDLLTVVRAFLKERDRKPGKVYLGLVHRLDRPVAGAMVVAKTSKAAGRLARQFRERTTIKLYRAVVEGVPGEASGVLRHYLRKDRGRRLTEVVDAAAAGRLAELEYRVLASRGGQSLLEVEPITGLPHQIRAQLAALGHPVAGDRKYGSRTPPVGEGIALCSRSLTVVHPVRGEPLTVTAELPVGWPW